MSALGFDRVLVVGIGVSGASAARHLVRLGAEVTITDDAGDAVVRERAAGIEGARAVVGGADPALVSGADLVVASPGVRPTAPVLEAARAHGVPIWSEVELACRIAKAPILGVTGTNGKTTTTQMLTECLRSSGIDAIAAGNIGHPLCDAAESNAQVIVAELSSFQLHFVHDLHVRAGILLNIAPDHLDWHGSFSAYAADKARLFENQDDDDVAVIALELAPKIHTRAQIVPFGTEPAAAGIEDGWIVVPQGPVVQTSRLQVAGRAMLADAVAASAAACAIGASPAAAARALESFTPAAHRMERVAEVDGVTYVDDSKATNPHAAAAALDGLGSVILIAGGRNKGLDLSPLADAENVRHVVSIGEAAGEVEAAFAGRVPVERAHSMDEAVECAAAAARTGDVVLLSPACASFDMFGDYKARGEAFHEAVKRRAR